MRLPWSLAIPFVDLRQIAKKYIEEISFGTFNFFKYQLARCQRKLVNKAKLETEGHKYLRLYKDLHGYSSKLKFGYVKPDTKDSETSGRDKVPNEELLNIVDQNLSHPILNKKISDKPRSIYSTIYGWARLFYCEKKLPLLLTVQVLLCSFASFAGG